MTAEGDFRKFSDIEAWYAIEDCAQFDKKCSNPTSTISNETIANLNAQIVGDDMVMVQVSDIATIARKNRSKPVLNHGTRERKSHRKEHGKENDLKSLRQPNKKRRKTGSSVFVFPYWNSSMIDDEEARDNFLKDVCTFLRKFSHIPFGVTPKVILIAWESFGEIKDALMDKQYDRGNKKFTINPLFDEVLGDIECKDSYDSNLDESTFLVTPPFDSNKDECLTLGDGLEFLLHHDPSTPLKSVASILEGFIEDLPFEENENLFDLKCQTNDWKRILYDAPIDEAECFDPGGNNDEVDAFLAIGVPTYIERYYDSEGDITYLESLLSDDTTHNLSPEVFFDHEPQQLRNEPENEPLITFSPKSDPIHHEFTGELITIPLGIVREHEDYINRMSLLYGNSFSQSPENFHTIIESFPTSTTLIEDSDSNREEIDIFSRLDDSIPPGIESDFDSEEDIIDNLLNDDPIHERLTFDMEPNEPVINNVDELNEDECFDPGGGEINVEVDNSFTFVTRTFLPFLTYPEVSPLLSSTKNKDTIFDPGIST
ncbi:hypothetical protein Tco_0548881 [Tanacetum coccineum]